MRCVQVSVQGTENRKGLGETTATVRYWVVVCGAVAEAVADIIIHHDEKCKVNLVKKDWSIKGHNRSGIHPPTTSQYIVAGSGKLWHHLMQCERKALLKTLTFPTEFLSLCLIKHAILYNQMISNDNFHETLTFLKFKYSKKFNLRVTF